MVYISVNPYDVYTYFSSIKAQTEAPDMLYVCGVQFYERCECYAVQTDNGSLVGCVTLLTPGENGSEYDFDTIAIDKERWGQGLATEIIRHFVDDVYPGKMFRCTIHPSNIGSRIAFERNGFTLYNQGEAYNGLKRCFYERIPNDPHTV